MVTLISDSAIKLSDPININENGIIYTKYNLISNIIINVIYSIKVTYKYSRRS